MNTFDPWTATSAEALEHFSDDPGITDEHMRYVHAQAILRRQPDILGGDGRAVLEAVAECARYGLALPAWLAGEFLRRFDAVRYHRAASWDDPQVFGLAHPDAGRDRPTRTQLAAFRGRSGAAPVLERLFAPGGLPRTAAGYAEAARRLRLTVKQVRTWLPKTRANTRGAKHDTRAELADVGIRWHDPFGNGKPLNRTNRGPL